MKIRSFFLNSKTLKNAVRGALVVNLALTAAGCKSLVRPSPETENTREVPTETYIPTPTEEPTSTPLPTFTPTPEATSTPTVEPTPEIPENPGEFEGVGTIASIEQNPADGKWYGIDTMGRAEIVNEKGEWIKYERPIGIDTLDRYKSYIPDELLGDLNQEKITRLYGSLENVPLFFPPQTPTQNSTNSDSESLPWGLVKTEINPSNNNIHYYFSGYPLGTFNFIRKYEGGQQSFTFMLFEIPLKYGRQILMVNLIHPENQIGNRPVWTVPPSGNVSELNMEYLSAQESLDIFTAPEAVGKQIVIHAFVDVQATDPFPVAYKAAINQLINNLKSGKATDIISINTWSLSGPPVVFPEELKKH